MISFEEWPTWKCKVYSVLFHCPVQLCGVGTLWCALVGISSCLKKTRHGLNWKHWNMIEDKSVTCTACMFLVLQLQKFKLKANSKASVGSERSFSEQIQPWSASPIARSSVHVCLWFLRQACGGSILYFFCVVMQCVSTKRDFCIHSYRNFWLFVKFIFFAGFCKGIKFRTDCRVLGLSLADGWCVGSIGNRFGPSQTGCTVGACEGTEKIMWLGEKKIHKSWRFRFFSKRQQSRH